MAKRRAGQGRRKMAAAKPQSNGRYTGIEIHYARQLLPLRAGASRLFAMALQSLRPSSGIQ